MTSSVVSMLNVKSINVEGREGDEDDGETCLMNAAGNCHLDICRLLINKGAQLEAKDSDGWTPLFWAGYRSHVEVVRLAMVRFLCDRGAVLEVLTTGDWRPRSRPLRAAMYGHNLFVRSLK